MRPDFVKIRKRVIVIDVGNNISVYGMFHRIIMRNESWKKTWIEPLQ